MSAQIDDLLRNKDITWVAESYNDFSTEQAHEEKIGKTINFVTPLKFLNKTEAEVYETAVFQDILLNNVKEGKVQIYKDADCKHDISYNDVCHFDTVNIQDPINYEEKVRVVRNEPFPEQILFFRTRQVVYYNAKEAQFGLRTLAVGPMTKVLNNEGILIDWKPLFWIKVTDLTKKRKLTESNITWAARMKMSNGIALTEENEVKVLKKVGDNMPMSHLFNVLEQNPKVPFYTVEESNPKMKYTFEERFRLINYADTIIEINPISNKSAYKIVRYKMKMDDIKRLRLVQNWYWNDKKKRLEIYLMATAPMKDVNNEAGELLFKQPLFYRRTDD